VTTGRPFSNPEDAAAVRLDTPNAPPGPPLAVAAAGAPALPDGLAPTGAPPAIAGDDIVALMVTRNEALRLPSALRHLWRLGADRLLLVDNRSTDGTREIAAADNRVHLVDAPGSYAGSNFGVDWTNALLDRYARGHWVLVVDADELLVFPGSEGPGAASLRALCRHLDAIGSEALPTVLLDCFPEQPLRDLRFRSGDELTEAAPWFEPPSPRRERSEHFPYFQQFGGLRERLFFPEADPSRPARMVHQKLYNLFWRLPPLRRARWFRDLAPKRSPNLTKVPLFRWKEGAGLVSSTHMLRPLRLAPEQPSGVLLHFKFLQDFHARAEDAVARGAHYDGSREYRRYLEALGRDPAFSLHSGRSVRYAGPDQLVALGLMRDTPGWAEARRAAAEPAPAAG
jgi:glycosyl transferase family 2